MGKSEIKEEDYFKNTEFTIEESNYIHLINKKLN